MDDSATQHAYSVGAAASLGERRLHSLKSADTFGVFDQNGNILAGPGIADGLYHRDTRYLSALDLTLNGATPILLSSTIRDNNATLTCDLTNPDFHDAQGHVTLPHDTIHLRRSRFIWKDACHERILIRNFSDRAEDLTIVIGFDADFADLFEARGMTRSRHGARFDPVVDGDMVGIAYEGLDQVRRFTRVRFSPSPTRLDPNQATFRFTLAPQQRAILNVEIACDPAPASQSASQAFLFSLVDARRSLRLSSSRATGIETSNEIFNEAIRRSICDLYMLITDKETGPYPYAGVPWYSTAFGRDALISAMHTLWIDPAIARGVLFYLARHQAQTTDPIADAEPGKILHEVRHGEMAELGEVPFRHYYGSVDSTPLFVWLAGLYWQRTNDLEAARYLWPHVEAALGWIDKDGDRDGDGFVEYGRRNADGLLNQGWKDSFDSIFHDDGTLADGPIALVEVQGYVFAAKMLASGMARALGHDAKADALIAEATRLREKFEAAFWCEDLDTYAIALDGAKRPCRVRSSNAGHLLMTGIAREDRCHRVAAGLMSRSFFTGWGIRTIAAGEPRYNPMAYHNGSVWPHDNALIGLGFSDLSLKDEAERLFTGLFDAAFHIDQRRLPELFCGFPRERGLGPVRYPVACSPQAWAATTLPALVQSTLGIRFEPAALTVHFDRPRLPPFIETMTLHNLAIGEARATVHLKRLGNEVAVTVLDRVGGLRVQITS
jgi:glycogen debranching enzyme